MTGQPPKGTDGRPNFWQNAETPFTCVTVISPRDRGRYTTAFRAMTSR
jgi:hypothetical protein